MKRTNIIQSLIDKVGAENYLEVGVSAGENFRDIKCKNKVWIKKIKKYKKKVKSLFVFFF